MVHYWFKDDCEYSMSVENADEKECDSQSAGRISREISEEDGILKFVDHSFHPLQLDEKIESRTCGKPCDVTLHVGRYAIKAHRAVLSAFSKYFKGLLNQDMKESKQSDVEIWELDGYYVDLLVDFAYTSEILINPENVQGILETANFLAIDSVCEECCNYMIKYLSSENCVGVFHLADSRGFVELKREAYRRCVLLFNDNVLKGKMDFFYPQLFIELLKSDDLLLIRGEVALSPSIQEQVILETALSFVNEDISSRAIFLPEILSVVRLPLVADEYLQELKTNTLIKESIHSLEIIEKALRTPVCSMADWSASFWCKPRQHAGLKFKCSQAHGIRETTTFFNDRHTKSYVVGLKILMTNTSDSQSSVVRGLVISYGNNMKTKYGQTECGDVIQDIHEFKISDHQRITRVDVKHGLSIHQMTFHTDTQQYGPYGTLDGSGKLNLEGSGRWTSSTTSCPEQSAGYLAYLKGSIVNTEGFDEIVELQFAWGYYDFKHITNYCKKKLCITKSFIKLKH